MKVTYLYHSGFAVELEKHIFVFDYMKGKLPDWDGRKEIIFFVQCLKNAILQLEHE